MKDFSPEEFLRKVFKARKLSSAALSLPNSMDLQIKHYDDFFQFSKFGVKQKGKLSSVGLHEILEDLFPISISASARIEYHGYEVEDPGRDFSQCLSLHLTYGKQFLLKLTLEGQVDIDLKNKFDNQRFLIEYRSKGLDVVPVLTDEGNFLVSSGKSGNPPIIRMPILNAGLINTDDAENQDTYFLDNIRIYFLSDYLTREINKELRIVKREINWRIEKNNYVRPLDVANKICSKLSLCIYKCMMDSHVCPPVIDLNPIAKVSQQTEVSHIGPFGVKGKRANIKRRHIHYSHYSRLCPLETPESESIGLKLHIARGAILTYDGDLYARYGQPGGLPIRDEIGKKIGSYQDINSQDNILAKKDNAIETVKPKEIDLWERLPGQFLGQAASLIPFIQHNDPTRATMGAKNMKQAVMLKKAEEPFVKTGFESAISQNLSLGRNLLVAYMPWYGYNYEDGIVVSEKTANDMSSEKKFKTISIPVWGNEKPYCNLERIKGYSGLTEEGIVSPGIEVGTGDLLARIHETMQFMNDVVIISRFREEKVTRYVKGKVKEAVYETYHDEKLMLSPKTLRGMIKIVIAEDRPLSVGDKLMGRHGNKGVVSKILPEKEMPYFLDSNGIKDTAGSPAYHGEVNAHTHIEIILNPFGVISRMNLGQLMETHIGMVTQKSSNEYKNLFLKDWKPFEQVNIEELSEGLKATGLVNDRGSVKLKYYHNGQLVETKKEVVIGYQYILKLDHMAEDKYHGRNTGSKATITGQALKGRGKGGGMRLGEMEVWSLQAHSAVNTMTELLGQKADDPYCTGFSRSLQAFVMYLRGLGLSLEFKNEKGKSVTSPKIASRAKISFATDDVVMKWSNGEVRNRKFPKVKIRQKNGVKKTDIEFNHESLFSRTIFGIDEVDRFWKRSKIDKDDLLMGHIELSVPVLHPLLYMTGEKELFGQEIDKLMHLARPFCKRWSSKRKKYYDNRSDLKKLLVTSSTNSQIKEGDLITVWEYIKNEKTVNVVELAEIVNDNKLIKKYNVKNATKFRKYFLKKIPVVPITLRPYLYDHKTGGIIRGDINNLYSDVILANEQMKTAIQRSLSSAYIHLFKEKLEIAVNRLFLLGKKENGKLMKSISHLLKGKEGLLRQSILGKRCNYSGRAVIVPDPYIEMDEVVIPWEIGRLLYPDDKIDFKIEDQNRRALPDRYLVITRAPSLHKYSVQAFKPVIEGGHKAIKINPAICQPFNADFDGDQMSIFVVNDKRSITEVKDKLLPQRNLVSVAGGQFMPSLSLDIRLGIYLMLNCDEGKKFLVNMLGNDVNDNNYQKKLKLLNVSLKSDAAGKDIALLLRKAFEYATEYGISFGLFDLLELDVDRIEMKNIFKAYFKEYGYRGFNIADMDENEKDKYKQCADNIMTNIKEELGIGGKNKGKIQQYSNNPVSVIYTSGAKKDDRQIMQLVGAKGFLQYPLSGESLAPVVNNYCKGLHPFEYFVSTYQSRSNVMDKKLKTAPCGYLTRRLVSATYEIVISSKSPCTSKDGLPVLFSNYGSRDKLRWLIGRYLAEEINTKKAEYKRNVCIDEEILSDILEGKPSIKIRSPLTCRSRDGVCGYCYGIDLSTGSLPASGSSVGIIAGQSVGERLTQLAMRSYHSGTAEGVVNAFDRIQDGFDGTPKKLSEKGTRLFNGRDLPMLLNLYDYKVDSKHFEIILKCMENGKRRISDVALEQESFLSAASFASLVEVLSKAAFDEKEIPLDGLKDRLFTGRL